MHRGQGADRLGGFDSLSSLKVDKDVLSLWFDAVTYVTSALIVMRLPIPRPERDGTQKFDLASSIREIKEGVQFMRSDEQRVEIESVLSAPEAIGTVYQPLVDLRTGEVAGYEAKRR